MPMSPDWNKSVWAGAVSSMPTQSQKFEKTSYIEITNSCSKIRVELQAPPNFMEKLEISQTIRIDSRCLPVARGGSVAKVLPLAARPNVDVSFLLWASSGVYGIRYFRAMGYFSMSQPQCATGPARESRVGPRRPRVEKSNPAHMLFHTTTAR